MSTVSFPVSRHPGRALFVSNPGSLERPRQILARLGMESDAAADPYQAMRMICRHRSLYSALILSLSSLYREELQIIACLRRRLPYLEIWLTHTDGRQAAMADAMRLGADGLLSEEGLHRIGQTDSVLHGANPAAARMGQAEFASSASPVALVLNPTARNESLISDSETGPSDQHVEESDSKTGLELNLGEPVLTADELRALLQDQPGLPPSGGTG